MTHSVRAWPLMSVEEFEALAPTLPDGKAELVRGEVRLMSPASPIHGVVATNVAILVGQFVRSRRIGLVLADNTGFTLVDLPRTVRSPDGAWFSPERLALGAITERFGRVCPDLVVEVLSPDETARELQEKLDDYWAAGAREAWVFDPRRRTVTVKRPGEPDRVLQESDTLSDTVVPGFSCLVAEFFEGIAR
jgi:Uma2 family endonuclease